MLEARGEIRKIGALTPVSSPVLLSTGMQLVTGDRIKAGQDGWARLGLVDGSTIEIEAETDLEILNFKGGIRELFKLWIGKVRLKIRKITGAPNPYEMHTPIATIGVRGTEFDIEVDQNTVTTVRVQEGLVAVKNIQVDGDEVLVPGGQQVTLYPLRPPDPPVTFEQVVAENFNRETTEDYPLLRKFLAFPDSHLDLLDNPAYAGHIVEPSGRFYFYPARSQSFQRPEISPLSPLHQFADVDALFATDERLLQGLSTRFSYARPVGDWVLAGLYEYRGFDRDFSFHINRRIPTAFGGEVSIQQIGNSLYAPNLTQDTDSHRTMFLAARRFPGQTVAVSYDWTHSGGDINTLYELRPGGFLLTSDRSVTGYRTDNQKITFGYSRDSDGLGSLGMYFSTGFVSGNSGQRFHEYNGRPADLAEFTTTGVSQETGIKWRKKISPSVFVAAFGSLTRTSLDESILNFRFADSKRESLYWVPSVGGGLGVNWRDRIFAALDYQYSNLRQRAIRREAMELTTVSAERGGRHDHALHGWIQVQLPWSLFAGGGLTSYWSSEVFRGQFEFDSSGRRVDSHGRAQGPNLFQSSRFHLDQLGFSAGRRFGDTLFIEYQLTQTLGPLFRPLSHSLLLRLAF